MAYPTFDSFSLQDSNYITEQINYRTIPNRSLDTKKIARKPGVKLLAEDFAERTIKLRGYILGSNISDLKSKIDDLHSNITRKEDGTLQLEEGRTCTATLASIVIADPHYAQDFVPFDLEFLLADPFFYGDQQTVSWTVTSGTSSTSKTITISGTVFAEPSIKYFSPDASGQTTISGVQIEYTTTGESVTWSGTGATTTLAYSDDLAFDYANQLILEAITESDIEGVFSRWEPGSTNFTCTFSGTAPGGSLNFSYQPRYL